MLQWIHLVVFGFGLALVSSMVLEALLFPERHFDIYFYVYFSFWVLITAINLPHLKNLSRPKINWSVLALITGFFVLAGTLSYKEYNHRAIWMDEMVSMTNVLESDYASVTTATYFHQPPTEQQIMLLFGLTAGYKTWTVRGPALTCLFLFLIFFPLIIYKMTGSTLTTALAGIFYCLNPYLIYYSVEGRPLQMSILFFTLYFYTNYQWIQKKANANLTAIWSTGLMLVLSVNVQAIAAFFSIFVATVLIRGKQIPEFKKYFGIHLSVLAAFFPVFWASKQSANSMDRVSTDWWMAAIDYLHTFNFNILHLYFEGNMFLVPLTLILLSANLIAFRKSFLKSWSTVLLVASLIFFFGMDFFNQKIMLWDYYIRYILIFFPLFLFFVVFLHHQLEKSLSQKWRFPLFIFSLAAAAMFFPNQSYPQLQTVRTGMSDVHDLYDYLKANTRPEDYIQKINLGHYGQWRQGEWFSAKIHMPKEIYPQFRELNHEIMISEGLEHVIPYDRLIENREIHLYLVEEFLFTMDLYKALEKLENLVEWKAFERANLYHIVLREGQTLEDYKRVFQTLMTHYEDPSRLGYAYEVLFYIAVKEKDLETLLSLQTQFENLRSVVQSHNEFYRKIAIQELETLIQNVEMNIIELQNQIQESSTKGN